MQTSQSASAVLMVSPNGFGYDEQTATSNSFQKSMKLSKVTISRRSMQEFQNMVSALRAHDIRVVVADPNRHDSPKPNAIFVNNWLSTWPNGRVYLYPMAHENRRQERSLNIVRLLSQTYTINQLIDLSEFETTAQYLESTGAMVFDHLHKVVYGCVSLRCDETLFKSHAKILGYQPILFHAYTTEDAEIYHTNVLLSIQTKTAVICDQAIVDEHERHEVLTALKASSRDIILINHSQLAAFCGNILELRNSGGKKFLVMSQTAYDAFNPDQRKRLSKTSTLIVCPIPTIENLGGGSVRCMLEEIFLPEKNSEVNL